MNIYKTLRKEKGITQVELSNLLNLRQSTISAWEVNKSIPDYPTMKKLADFFDVSVDYLIGREDDFGVKTHGENLNNLAINELNDAEKTIVEIYRKLPEQRQQMLCQTAKDYYRVCFGEDKLSKFKVGS